MAEIELAEKCAWILPDEKPCGEPAEVRPNQPPRCAFHIRVAARMAERLGR